MPPFDGPTGRTTDKQGDDMKTKIDSALRVEIQHRINLGCEILTIPQFVARFAALGYRVDRSMDCRAMARYLDDGRTYPACNTGMSEADTGRSAYHFESRRDSKFQAMQALRGQVFSISRGAILEA